MFTALIIQEQDAINQALTEALQRLPSPVRDAAAYAMMAGGKRLRPLLALLVLRLFQCRKPESYKLAVCLEMVHVASLMHDDILDEAATRRGHVATHRQFGTAACLLAGDALMAEANSMVASYGMPDMVDCLAEAISRTVSGEVQEIAMQGSLEHGFQTYLDIITGKTAWLLRACCRLGALYAEAPPGEVQAISEYGLNMGIAFQMVDDALDVADEAVTGKPTGGDLREGKCTPPILRYADTLPHEERELFVAKFRQGTFRDEEAAAISRRIRELGLDVQTRAQADVYLQRAAKALDEVPDRPERALLRQALDYVRDRKK